MEFLLQLFFWISAFGIIHSYVIYPLLLRWWGRGKQLPVPAAFEEWPRVTILMSLYNEEVVIRQKMDSLVALNYPGRLECYIGSDASSDQTNAIVQSYADQYPHIQFFPFQERGGKPGVINRLIKELKDQAPFESDHILLFTDASVMLEPDTVVHLVRHFSRPEIALVDTHMQSLGLKKAGISRSENQYIGQEVWIKHLEGILWGCMIGPFGGCFALRSTHYHPVPSNYLVDDFYLAFKAFEQGGKAVNDLNAICYEAISHDPKEEFRRKARISAGNFQNLITFRKIAARPWTPLGFAFWSHKILRWMGPFFILTMLICSGVLWIWGNLFYGGLLIVQLTVLLGIPLMDYLLRKANIHWLPLRHLNYLIYMNLALFAGFIRFTNGIKSNVWQPTKRILRS